MSLYKNDKNQCNGLYFQREFSHHPLASESRIFDRLSSPSTACDLLQASTSFHGNQKLNLSAFIPMPLLEEDKQYLIEPLYHGVLSKEASSRLATIEAPCIRLLASLWHCGNPHQATGCSTTDVADASFLAGMAMKWNWRNERRKQGLSDAKPNLVLGENAHASWETFCRHHQVELRKIPMVAKGHIMDIQRAIQQCDENTIGVIAVLGSLFTGEYEPIEALNHEIEILNHKKNLYIPLHVDASSGGFIVPFLHPELPWDFQLSCVKSITASGHQSRAVHPGIGWILWKDASQVPPDLINHGEKGLETQAHFTFSFSRPKKQIIAEYYDFLRSGKDDFQRAQKNCQKITNYLAEKIKAMGVFKLVSEGHHLPVLTWTLKTPLSFTLKNLSERLHSNGWSIPVYTIHYHQEKIQVLRAVIREDFSYELADLLIADIHRALSHFKQKDDSKDNAAA